MINNFEPPFSGFIFHTVFVRVAGVCSGRGMKKWIMILQIRKLLGEVNLGIYLLIPKYTHNYTHIRNKKLQAIKKGLDFHLNP